MPYVLKLVFHVVTCHIIVMFVIKLSWRGNYENSNFTGFLNTGFTLCAYAYSNFPFAITPAIGLNAFQQDQLPLGMISQIDSLLNSFHREGLLNFAMISLCSNNIKENLYPKHGIASRTCSQKSLIMALIVGFKSKSSTIIATPPQTNHWPSSRWQAKWQKCERILDDIRGFGPLWQWKLDRS